jgi:hypothetical protein
MRNAYKILVGRPEGKRTTWKSRHRWEDIRMDFREIGWEDGRLVSSEKCGEQWQSVNTVKSHDVP